MLSNAYFLAKFRFDTAENEPAKKLQNLQNVAGKRLANLVNFVLMGILMSILMGILGFAGRVGRYFARASPLRAYVGTNLIHHQITKVADIVKIQLQAARFRMYQDEIR